MFAKAPAGIPGRLIITPCRGLLQPETIVGLDELSEIAEERVAVDNPKYRDPLERDLGLLSQAVGSQARVVLLGSIATRKYIPLLIEKLEGRLVLPREFCRTGKHEPRGTTVAVHARGARVGIYTDSSDFLSRFIE